MNIKCPQCDTLYDVSEEIANSGAQVQCAKCNDIFTATPAPEPEEIVLEPISTPEPEPIPAPVPVPVPVAEPVPEPEAIPEPEAMAQEETEQPSELLRAEEKEFFTSFGNKIAEEEAAEAAAPPAEVLQDDDIGWVEEDVDEQPAEQPEAAEAQEPEPAEEPGPVEEIVSLDEPELVEEPAPVEEPGPMEEIEPTDEIDLFGDTDLEASAEKPAEPEIIEPVEELIDTPEETPEATVKTSKIPKLTPVLMGWGALAASIMFVVIGATLFRVPIVKALPGMAGLYDKVGLPVNIRGLEFVSLNHQWMKKGGRTRLVVRGEIVNITDSVAPIPEIIFSMLDQSGLEFFQWTERAGPTSLKANGRARFRAQIPAPANRVRQLKIRFAKR